MMEIHLIRHGKTKANEQRLYCGRTDLPLSESGKAELISFKSHGIYPPSADLFFTSGLARTGQTVDILYGNVGRTTIPGIAEYDFGFFEMKSYDELKEREDYQAWITDETGMIPCPSGESKKQVEKRVIKGYAHILSEIVKTGGASAFISCHGGTIACIMEFLQPNTKHFYGWQPQPGRGYSLTYISERFHKYISI
jgi:alpha-ribazole phosphatase